MQLKRVREFDSATLESMSIVYNGFNGRFKAYQISGVEVSVKIDDETTFRDLLIMIFEKGRKKGNHEGRYEKVQEIKKVLLEV